MRSVFLKIQVRAANYTKSFQNPFTKFDNILIGVIYVRKCEKQTQFFDFLNVKVKDYVETHFLQPKTANPATSSYFLRFKWTVSRAAWTALRAIQDTLVNFYCFASTWTVTGLFAYQSDGAARCCYFFFLRKNLDNVTLQRTGDIANFSW